MKRPLHFAWARAILVLAMAGIGGLVGVYGIHSRPDHLRTNISSGRNGDMSPDDSIVLNCPAPMMPAIDDGTIKANPGINAKIAGQDAHQELGITPQRSGRPEAAQQCEVIIYPRNPHDAGSDYRGIDASNSETSPPQAHAEDCSLFVRIEPAYASQQPKIREGKYIDVNLSTQSMSIFEDGKLLDSYLVSTGKMGKETPKGTHAIANKSPRAWSKKYQVYLPYWMAIMPSGVFGIHELPECPDGCKEGADELGVAVSHGCVRLGIGAAERVYNWAEIGTPVVVY
jgi:lipoprotein-anchoring transpeptidase ErfK/SrfK